MKDASRPLEVVSAADARFSSRVELSVRFGKTLLVLECDGVEPMLYPLARQDLLHQGPRFVVQVGDKVRVGYAVISERSIRLPFHTPHYRNLRRDIGGMPQGFAIVGQL